MSKYVKILVLVLLPILSFSQQYDYAKLLGGIAGDAYTEAIATDNTGNVYIKGTYTGAQEIGGTLYRTLGNDAFIAKFDINGNLTWFKNVGFSQAEDGSFDGGGIVLDASNNIYITGGFTGDALIEGTSLINEDASGISQDVYVIKYDLNGTFVWATSFGGSADDNGIAITVDAVKNVYVGGASRSATMVFSGAISTIGTGSRSAFWTKINNTGTHAWLSIEKGGIATAVRSMDFNDATSSLFIGGDISSDIFYRSIKADLGTTNWSKTVTTPVRGAVLGLKSFGSNLYLTGYFTGTTADFIQFPYTIAPSPELYNKGSDDIFLASVDSAGGLNVWSKSYGNTRAEVGTALSIDNTNGNVYITGYYQSPIDLMGVTLPAPTGIESPFIGSTDVNGIDILGKEILAAGNGTGLAINPINSTLYTTGYYSEGGDFGFTPVNQKNNTYYVGSNKLNNFNFNWANSPPKGQIIVQHMVVDNNDNLFIGGYFDGTINVMGTTISSLEITSDPSVPAPDLFIAKMNADETFAWIKTAGGSDADTLVGISYDGEGSVYLNAKFANNPIIDGNLLNVIGNIIVKFDQSGSLVFTEEIILPPNSNLTAMVGDNSIGGNEVIAGGYFQGTPSPDLLGYNVSSLGLRDIFIFKISSSGGIPLTNGLITFSGTGDDMLTDMAKSPAGDILITGWSSSPTLSSTPISIAIPPANGFDIFIASITTLLNPISGFSDGGLQDQFTNHISVNSTGDIAIAGSLSVGGNFSGTVLNATPGVSYFTALYNNAGALSFAKEITTTGDPSTKINDLALDNNGNLFLAGSLLDPLNFGDGNVFAIGDTDGFLAGYDNTGNLLYAQAYGGDYSIGAEAFDGYDYGHALATNSSDELWYSGSLSIKAEAFGPFTLQPASSEVVSANKGMDSYLLRLAAEGTVANSDLPKIYWTESTGNQINRSNIDGNSFEQFFTDTSTPNGLAIDTENNIIYWSNNLGDIWKGTLDPTGIINPTKFIDDGTDLSNQMGGIALDVPNDKIYWASTYDNELKVATLSASDANTTIQTVLALALDEYPNSVAIDATAGKLYYTYSTYDVFGDFTSLYSVGIDGLNDTYLIDVSVDYASNTYEDVKVDVANNKLYWSGSGNDIGKKIFQADLFPFANISSFSTTDVPSGIDIDRAGTIYWIEIGASSKIMRANTDGTNQVILQSGTPNLGTPRFLVLDITSAVGCINPPTISTGGSQTICEGSLAVLLATQGGTPTSISWGTNGDGTFSSINSLSTTYTPGPNDIIAGAITIGIIADDPDGSGPCQGTSDEMQLTINLAPTVNAGADILNCAGATLTMNGSVGGSAYNVTWSTSGTGTFGSPNYEFSSYTPTAADIASGSVILTITTDDPDGAGPCTEATDQLIMSFSSATVNAGADITSCGTGDITLSGGFGGAASSILWTSPSGGTFIDASLTDAIYSPSTADIAAGFVTLTITTDDPDGSGPCTAATDQVLITFGPLPIVSAGIDQTVCANDPIALDGSFGGGATSILWSSALGDGTFSDVTDPLATYLPGSNDKLTGSVTLTITSVNPSSCTSVIDDVILTFEVPTVSANTDQTVCGTGPVGLSGSFGGAATSIFWSSALGDGTFSDVTDPLATYLPGANDMLTGSVTLTITSVNPSSCTSVFDDVILTFAPILVDAGADQTICANSSATVLATLTNATTGNWSTDGDGTFNDSNNLNAIYTPGTTDSGSSITLTFTVPDPDGSGSCIETIDQLLLTVNSLDVIDAGVDQTICETGTVALSATIDDATTPVFWVSSGDGGFDVATSLSPIYSPGTTDRTNGSVILTISSGTPSGKGVCPTTSDALTVTLALTHTADAGADQTICPSDAVTLAGAVGGGASAGTWLSDGDGTFDDNTSLTANYTPGNIDSSAGTVILTLSTVATNCSSVSDQIQLNISLPITATDQSASLQVSETTIIDVLNGASINSGDVITTTILSQPTKGTATVNNDGTINYLALTGNVGDDSFVFQIENQCNQSASASALINIENAPPAFDDGNATAVPGSPVVISITDLITDLNGNIDLSSIAIIQQPGSGAPASLNSDNDLIVDYTGIVFFGTDEIVIEVCDFDGACSIASIFITVEALPIEAFNAVSPNGDGRHDFLEFKYIEAYPNNQIKIFNRWGDIVFEIENYDNQDNIFTGNANRGGNNELPTGTYYYSVYLTDTNETINGYFELRR